MWHFGDGFRVLISDESFGYARNVNSDRSMRSSATTMPKLFPYFQHLTQGLVRVVQFIRSVMSDSLRLHGLQHGTGFPVHHQLPELAQLVSIESVMPSSHLILCPLLLLLPSIFPRIRVFSNEEALRIRWPKY